MAVKAVQQIMLGTVCKNEAQALETLKAVKAAGYDGLELNGFMIRPTSFMVRMMTKAAGMPVGKGGNFDWKGMLAQAGLCVVSVHEDLGSIKRDAAAVIKEAKEFGTDKIVITGMYRFKEDIKMMADAGLNAYRFSVEWARIEPVQGHYDEAEIEHYRKVLECCKANGIEPVVTMLHFTSPKWLIEKGGWENEETIGLFADYCRYVTEKLGSYMHYVCTINEANMGLQIAAVSERFKKQMMAKMAKTQQADAAQSLAEAARDTEGSVQVGLNMQKMMENMQKQGEENRKVFGVPTPQVFVSARTPQGDLLVMKAHQAAKKAIKEVNPSLQVGITLSLHDIQAEEGGEENAAREWKEEFLHYVPYLKDDDFFGLQNYTRSVYDADGICAAPEKAELTQMDYEIYPQALEACIRKAYKELNIPIMVTENGIAVDDDMKRVDFIRKATDGVAACIRDGIPVKGYMYWSLLDNFEWQKGYSMTFGLIAVNRETQERIAKPSLSCLGSL